ncbi:hypothetical protein PIROE2DRAFT_3365 [Piromyces sp. E2]|nr:hypothetical protein PIROE2DRAFT_3365 [Piromyces sp. E2]|eukprot:OUM68845.1 hypothetical protein PIROE2DRAFT_3365 [Piromyces sp. E2]
MKPSPNTKDVWDKVCELCVEEIKSAGCFDIDDVSTISIVNFHKSGYIIKEKEDIVDLQTNTPLKIPISFSSKVLGDYRRVALYGVYQLIEWKMEDKLSLAMAKGYDFDISKSATTAKVAIQSTYFDGAVMSFGGVDICHLHILEYNGLFAGDPTWITMVVGSMNNNDRPLVIKISYRIINTLRALNAAPEPNITVLWNNKLPMGIKNFCNKIIFGDDYGIACCESEMKIAIQMTLHDTDVHRCMAFSVAGFSVLVDSFSAIKYANRTPTYRETEHILSILTITSNVVYGTLSILTITSNVAYGTLSILTITSNVVYGKKTGFTPDGCEAGELFASGCNPLYGREISGAVASLNSINKVDGISNTFIIVPTVLGKIENERVAYPTGLLDGYFSQGGFHLNICLSS